MKTTKRWLSVLLCALMTVMVLAVTVAAAGGETNVEFVADKTEVNVDDTFTISFNNKEMTVKGFTAGFTFDKTLVECVSIVGVDPEYPDDYSLISGGGRGGVTYTAPTAISSIEKANNAGTVGYAYAGTKDVTYLENTLFIVTFKAKAAGTANFTLYEETNGTDAFASENIDTIVVTIKSATPACEHTSTMLVLNSDGTHNVVCDNAECGQTVTPNVICTVDETKTKEYELRAADCCSSGLKQVIKYCACGWQISNDTDVVIPATGKHTLVKYEKAATCVSSGYKEYWECNNTTWCYEDADGQKEIDDISAWMAEGGDGYIPVDPTNHIGEIKYVDNYDNTHNATYDCCGTSFVTNEAHSYKDADTCICGAVKAPEHICVHDHYDITETTHQSICSCGKPIGDAEPHNYKTGVTEYICICGAKYTGWDTEIDGEDDVTVHTFYVINGVRQYSGWTKIDGDWYYLSTTSGYRAEGLSRVPYPKVEIEGNTYAPNAADIAYAESKDRDFIDATYAWFLFEEDGKFAYDSNGYISRGDSQGKLIKGMLPWHVGLVEVAEGEYRYFAGDLVNGGNVMATGKIYASRNTTDLDIVIGGIYFFDENGKMILNDGIVDIEGTLYYYEDGRLAIDAGLVKVGDDYYYVRSNGEKAGQLVVGREYWVSNTNGYFVAGMYEFDENGKMVVDPTKVESGIVEIDGVYYYYKAGVKQIGAGVVEMTDAEGETFYIYVKSNGQLATGEYWPTTTNGLLERGCYDWGTDGKYYPAN